MQINSIPSLSLEKKINNDTYNNTRSYYNNSNTNNDKSKSFYIRLDEIDNVHDFIEKYDHQQQQQQPQQNKTNNNSNKKLALMIQSIKNNIINNNNNDNNTTTTPTNSSINRYISLINELLDHYRICFPIEINNLLNSIIINDDKNIITTTTLDLVDLFIIYKFLNYPIINVSDYLVSIIIKHLRGNRNQVDHIKSLFKTILPFLFNDQDEDNLITFTNLFKSLFFKINNNSSDDNESHIYFHKDHFIIDFISSIYTEIYKLKEEEKKNEVLIDYFKLLFNSIQYSNSSLIFYSLSLSLYFTIENVINFKSINQESINQILFIITNYGDQIENRDFNNQEIYNNLFDLIVGNYFNDQENLNLVGQIVDLQLFYLFLLKNLFNGNNNYTTKTKKIISNKIKKSIFDHLTNPTIKSEKFFFYLENIISTTINNNDFNSDDEESKSCFIQIVNILTTHLLDHGFSISLNMDLKILTTKLDISIQPIHLYIKIIYKMSRNPIIIQNHPSIQFLNNFLKELYHLESIILSCFKLKNNNNIDDNDEDDDKLIQLCINSIFNPLYNFL
ncbi:hypothetical protein CYY_009996 [Polysphondylium violaceum]|uniref:Uncharacterized protein n=1 Tax=Polysphondylium violaceum TaxID=133409 RepID=A0A8J4UUU9_9MYCE|nr:hypothetical protein CYY_009996 [Polysphondylium violaceum]